MILNLLLSFFISVSAQAQDENKTIENKLSPEVQTEIQDKFKDYSTKLTPEMGDNIIRYLMNKGLYDKVEIEEEKSGGPYHIQVEYTHKISSLNYVGNHEYYESELAEMLQVKEGQKFDIETLLEGAEKIKINYATKGFLNAQVDLLLPKNIQGDIDVKVQITENQRTLIRKINFEISNKKLKMALEKISKKFEDTEYTEQNLKEFIDKIKEDLKENNYVRSEILEPQVSFNKDQTSVSLSYVIDKPEKYDFDFNGNLEFSDSSLTDALDINNFYSASIDVGAELAVRLKKFYFNKGFARIQVETEEFPKDEAFLRAVKFNIKEGPLIKIEKIKFIGQFAQKEKYYVELLKNNSGPLTSSVIYNKDEIELGLKNLITLLKNQGFLRAQVKTYHAPYNKEKTKVTLTVQLDEGPQTILKRISIHGNNSFTKEALLDIIDLDINKPLKLNVLESRLADLKNHYREKGFIDIDITNENTDLVTYGEDQTEAFLNFNLNEGPQVFAETIILDGNSFTKDYVILNELDFKRGDILTPNKIEESRNRLQKLGLFTQVEIKMIEEKTSVSKRTVVVKVSEANPGLFNMGMGFSNERELTLRGFIGIAYRNIGGTARGVSLRTDLNYNIADIQFVESKIAAGYVEPYIFNSRAKGRLNISREKQVTDYDTKEITEINQTTWGLDQNVSSHFSVSWDVWSLATVKESYLPPYNTLDANSDNQPDYKSSLLNIATTALTFEWDYRDHPFNTLKGSLHRLTTEYANPWLGSNQTIEYYKLGLQTTHYYNIKTTWVWANSLRGGYIQNLSTETNGGVPYDKKGFVLGGISTIRGFEAGTKERFPNDKDLGIQNFKLKTQSHYYLIKSEIRFPIYGNLGGALFYDGGAVYIDDPPASGTSKLAFREDPYRDAAGFAFRYTTPVGPLDLAIGFKLDRKKERGESSERFHFSFGSF